MGLDTKRIQTTIRKLRKLVKKAPRRPTPDNIHDLRTYTRRFEATAAALNLAGGNERRVLRQLARARRRAGKVRDMDVLTGYSTTVDAGQRQDCLVQLLEHLGARRYRQAKRLRSEVKKKRSNLRLRLKRTANRVDKLIPANNKGRAAEESPAVADAMSSAARLSRELMIPATLNGNNLHPYRLKVKELRNVLRMAENPDRAFIDSLGEVKDAIGEWHDWEELIAIASDLDEHGPNCELIRELKKISARKYEHALAITNQMRKQYLRASREARPSRSNRKPTQQVLRAVSAIAS